MWLRIGVSMRNHQVESVCVYTCVSAKRTKGQNLIVMAIWARLRDGVIDNNNENHYQNEIVTYIRKSILFIYNEIIFVD